MNKNIKNLTAFFIATLIAIPSFASAEVRFTELDTGNSIQANRPLGGSQTNPALVGDFFAAVDSFDTLNSQSGGSVTTVGSTTPAATNPLNFSNFFPKKEEKPSSNDSQLAVNTATVDSGEVLKGSASENSGEAGEVVRYANGVNPALRTQASVFSSGNSMLNSGGLFLLFVLALIFLFVARASIRRTRLHSARKVYSRPDRFHDMSRYQRPHQYQAQA